MDAVLPLTTRLRDGTEVTLREVTADDRQLILEGFSHVSDASRYMRYLGIHPELTEQEMAELTGPHTGVHTVIGAMAGHAPAAIARLIRLPAALEAEIAMTITDDFQNRGLGTLLMDTLMRLAKQQGLNGIRAYVHAQNAGMLGLLRQHSAQKVDAYRSELEMRVPL